MTLSTPQHLSQMTAQLRQDFLRMLLYDIPLNWDTPEALGQTHQFSFGEGLYFAFVLSARPKIQGESVQPQWLHAARLHCQQALSRFCHDGETLILGNRIYALGNSPCSASDLTGHLESLFYTLQAQPRQYTCQWTMGLGRYSPTLSGVKECIFSARHAIKYSVSQGTGKFYDGNQQSIIFEGGITLISTAEQLALQQALQGLDTCRLTRQISDLFQAHFPEIQSYPVYAYMLSLQCIQLGIQVLRENMPVDRKTYELEQQYETSVDDQTTLEELIFHTTQGLLALGERYGAFLENGRSRPIWLVLTYIQENFREKITLEQLAQCADRNPQYISALFSRECGISIGQYITTLRIEEAKRLLRSTNLPIGEVACGVGYQDPKYFSRIFQKETGLYPRAYRQSSPLSTPFPLPPASNLPSSAKNLTEF